MTREAYSVRSAKPEESRDILGMHRELARYCGYPDDQVRLTEERVRTAIEEMGADLCPQSYYFVAAHANGLAGMTLCHKIPFGWKGSPVVYIEDLYVRPEHRHGRGVGSRLAARACSLALEFADGDEDRASVRLDTGITDNEATLAFYRRLGMIEDNVNMRLSGAGLGTLARLNA